MTQYVLASNGTRIVVSTVLFDFFSSTNHVGHHEIGRSWYTSCLDQPTRPIFKFSFLEVTKS